MSHLWDKFIVKGEELFNYMKYNFNDMLIDNNHIKHFTLRDCGVYDLGTEDIMNKYGNSIEKELILWIKEEFNKNRLNNNNLWKPIRDDYIITSMYLGYRKLFKFKEYYFQLIIENKCNSYDICEYCNNNKFTYCFSLVLYGWKNNKEYKLQPYNRVNILDDNILPDNEWDLK